MGPQLSTRWTMERQILPSFFGTFHRRLRTQNLDQAAVSDRKIRNTKREQKQIISGLLLEQGNFVHSDGDQSVCEKCVVLESEKKCLYLQISHLERLVAEQKEKILTLGNALKCCREEITDKKGNTIRPRKEIG
ncbi:hypothetical protein PR048_014238 [Dryococelus australis]|uniref:Uncharacterized protein n=1 Tax=Dryococelus australis TaxID=614101 RepID=A0ABQ9HDW1_9NEOP|nr:hypothetical protein PR048_014238 [Dryococelus australis]